jgi:hypothetical protein
LHHPIRQAELKDCEKGNLKSKKERERERERERNEAFHILARAFPVL